MESHGDGYCLFDTAFGVCGVGWSETGLTRLQLPCADVADTEGRLRRETGGAAASDPPGAISAVIADLQRYFAGEAIDFAPVGLDLAGASPTFRSIYAAAREVGWGETTSYGALARRVGSPGAARAVGRAMATNPVPIIIPCHRVLASDGRLGGFSAFGGTVQKERLLILERVRLPL